MKKIYFFLFLLVFFNAAFSQTPVSMSSQPGLTYTETFADIANWTNNFAAGTGANRWGSVAVNATGAIPDGIKTTTSTATFATGTSGGVQRGSAETPATTTIELLSTGTTANTTAVAIDFFMDFTGVTAGTLSFDAATKFNSTGDRVGSVKVYWSTNGTTFTELTGTNLPYVATNNVAGSASITNIVLPAAFNGSSTARLRFYYHNGPTSGTAGSRPKISIDNLVVTATSASTPSLALSPVSLTFPSTNINTSSTPQSYTVTGTNLTAPVLITSAAPFFICETIGGNYTTSLNIAAADAVSPKTIFVQFSPTVAGTPTGSIDNNSTGAVQKTVAVSGTAVDASAPVITVNPGTLNFPTTPTGTTSASLTYTLSATNLTNDVAVSVAAPYSVSADDISFSTSLNVLKTDPALATGKTIYVRFSPTGSGSANGSVSNASTGATTKTVSLTGTGIGLINLGSSPYLQNFDGIGSGLPSGISVKTGATASVLGTDAAFATAPALWNNTGGGFKNFASGNNDQGVTQNTATDRALGVRQVTATDPGVAFVFQVLNTTGKINFVLDFNLQSLDASSPRTTTWRVDYGFGLNPSSYTVAGTTGTLTTGGSTFTDNPIHVNFGNALDNQSGVITIRIVTVTASSGSTNRPSTGIDDFALSWEDPAAKTISLSTTAVNFATTNVNASSVSTYTIVSQTNLTQPIILTATAPFTISTDNISFSSGLSVLPAEASNKTIYVKFSPTTAGVFTGTITHTSVGAVSKTVDLSGEAVNPAALTFNFNSCSVLNVPGSGFLSVNATGTQKWACSQYGRNSSNGVDVNGFSGGAAQTDDAWLISPPLNLNSIVNLPVLSFYSRGEFTGPKLQLYVSTTYNGSGIPNLSDWTEITTANFPTPPGTATTAWTLSDNIDLSAYKSAPVVYIAFRYTSSPSLNAARWSVDDVAITDQSGLLSVSPVQLSFGEVSVGANSASQAVTFQAIGNNDLTVTPPTGYQLSLNNSTFTSNPLLITQAVASAGTTLYVRFSPVAKALKVEGNINVSATGLNKDIVFVTGSSYPKSETFDAACYNISFFGSNSTNNATPTEIATQITNISTVMQRLNMDVIGIEEMSSDAALTQLLANLPGYASVVSNRWSYSFDPPDPNFPPQKIGFIYNTSTMTLSSTEPPRAMFESLYDSARLNLPNHRLTDYPTGTPSSFWGSGRLPFMATFNASIGGVTKKIRVVVIHAKSGGDADGYTRRQYDVKLLKDSLDAFYANDNVMIIGDYNDRVVTSIYVGHQSSYLPFVNDITGYDILTKPLDQAGRTSFPGSNGMIDHITISNELSADYISASADIEDPRIYIANYNAITGSDHLPVFSRFALVAPPSNGKTIPGKIEAENWDSKSGSPFAIATNDAGGGQQVVGMTNGSWLDYNVTVTQPGNYTVKFRVATTQNFAQFQIKSGNTVLGTINIPNTGGWDVWQTATLSNISLTVGEQTIRIQSSSNESCNFNWMEWALAPTANAGPPQTITLPANQVTLAGSGSANNGGSISSHVWTKFSGGSATITDPSNYGTTVTGLSAGIYVFRLTVTQNDNQTAFSDVTITVNPALNAGKLIPGKIEAESFDTQSGGMYSVITTDAGGGQQVVGIGNGSSIDYNVMVTQTGTYTVNFRVATTRNNLQFQVRLGATVLGTVNIPNSGDWNNWITASVTNVSLTAGAQTIRIQSNDACNFNWMDWVFVSPPVATVTTVNKSVDVSTIRTEVKAGDISLSVFPNPAKSYFNLKIQSKSMELSTIRIVDITGRLVQQLQAMPGQVIRLGDKIMSGTYMIEVRQGSERTVTKVVKQ
jgi:hypothetical protein